MSEPFETLVCASRVLDPDPSHSHDWLTNALSSAALRGEDSPTACFAVFQELLARPQDPEAIDFNDPFFRLPAHQRAVLTLVHDLKLSYRRAAEWLRFGEEILLSELWLARTDLARPHPVPAVYARDATCPEWDARSPWTQSYIDGACTPSERVFLQSHVLGCENCKRAVYESRALIQRAYMRLPPMLSTEEIQSRAWLLEQEFLDVTRSHAEARAIRQQPYLNRWERIWKSWKNRFLGSN